MPFTPKHPVGEVKATWFHMFLGAYYGLGFAYHLIAAYRHWLDRDG